MNLFEQFRLALRVTHQTRLGLPLALVLVILVTHWLMISAPGVGLLFLLPILVVAPFLRPWQIFALSQAGVFLYAYSRNQIFSPAGQLWVLLAGTTLAAAGCLFMELVRTGRTYLDSLRDEQLRTEQVESQLHALVDSSPVAVLTFDTNGVIALMNQAAREMFRLKDAPIAGQKMWSYLPFLSGLEGDEALLKGMRAGVEGRGVRRGGETFLAHVWLSAFRSATGLTLACIVSDISEEVRDREEVGLQQLLACSHILMGAVSHEIRNLCGAIRVSYANLKRVAELQSNADFRALGRLVESLTDVAAHELEEMPEKSRTGVALSDVLEEFRVIAGQLCREQEVQLRWETPENLPLVACDRSGLLQVLLNLTRNALRVMEEAREKHLQFVAYTLDGRALIRVTDSGPGVREPHNLFRPFGIAGSAAGLGLYISRAIVRTHGGDLYHVSQPHGACFVVELPVIARAAPAEGQSA